MPFFVPCCVANTTTVVLEFSHDSTRVLEQGIFRNATLRLAIPCKTTHYFILFSLCLSSSEKETDTYSCATLYSLSG